MYNHTETKHQNDRITSYESVRSLEGNVSRIYGESFPFFAIINLQK